MTLTASIHTNTTKSSREVMMMMFRDPAFIRHVCCTCGMKQYVPNKPNPVGFTNVVLTGKDGVIYHFGIYKGRETFPHMGPGVAGSSILALVQTVPTYSTVNFDRWFSSFSLVDELVKKKDRHRDSN
ncbi:hypothetical protein HPB47_004652 [Ixodes persulcatus]|uniref:Uncharacterized protein n=1 Tax=Ixodes persulcatus TaxID=34615 RepID=A0AC60PF65_IXOPE|nr:hypothetical protein HPB47_004652 [Ixodes persulcatus]